MTARLAKTTEPPSGFRFMARDWTIEVIADPFDGPNVGTNHRHKGAIYISDDQSPIEILDTIVHEIIHSITWLMGMGSHRDEEEFVRVIATGLVAILQDNPDLAAWIMEPR